MISGIVAIIGALAGLAPGVLQFFTQKASNAQALALEQLRLQAAKDGVALQIDLANSQSDIQQQQHLYTFAGALTGIKWIDGLTAFVRPYVTLVMFHLWGAVEVALLIYGWRQGYDTQKLAALVWTPDTSATMGAIVGFWFGNRMLVRGNQQMAATNAVMPASKTAASKPAPAVQVRIPDPPGSRT